MEELLIRQLSARFDLYKSLFDNNPDASYAVDMQGNFVLVNETAVQLTGYTEEELLQMNFVSLVKHSHITETFRHFTNVLNGEKISFDICLLNKRGETIDLHITAAPIRVHERILGVIGIARDTTERNRIQQEISYSRNQLQNVFDSIDICLWSQDVIHEQKIQISPACQKIYGYSQEQFMCHPDLWRQSIHPDDTAMVALQETLAYRGESVRFENRIIDVHGATKWISNYIVPVRNEAGEISRLDGVVTDISQRKEVEEQLQFMAFHDNLTGLSNQRMFQMQMLQEIEQAQAQNRKFALIYMDLDRFKFINDTLGHRWGDELLRILAERLRHCLRDSDVIARQGGDEFTILLRDITDIEEAYQLASRIIGAAAQPFPLRDGEYQLTTSLGMSIYPDHAVTLDELMKQADQAMYLAKEKGGSSVQIYSLGMNDHLSRKVVLEQALHKALEHQEFSLHYQPIIDISTNKVAGFEALLRWKHSKLGWISPAEFIPIAEESGLIIPIGRWILQTACLHAQEWQQTGLVPYVSVNISARQFEQDAFIADLSDILVHTALPPSVLKLEITESMAMQKVEAAMEKLKQLEQMGVDAFLDDFGTGYSSLGYLKKMAIKVLKIDQSFIQDLHNDQGAIVDAITAMAKRLKLKVIAEGVEKEQQLHFLRSIGCHCVQGYLFSKPLPAAEVQPYLRQFSI